MDRNFALSLPLAKDFNAYLTAALANNEITKDEWYEINKVYFTNLYLAQDNPRGQSGHGGDANHYAFSHLPIVDALYKSGTFLDVGCANGYLCESVYRWAGAVGFGLQVFGVDISEGLIELARHRLPNGGIIFSWAIRSTGSRNKSLTTSILVDWARFLRRMSVHFLTT